MAEAATTATRKPQRSNLMVAAVCMAFVAGMVGAAYAAVPLYRMFCQLTGYGGTTQRVTQYSDRILDREVTVRFDANVSGGVPWDFQPAQRDVTMKIGETTQIAYKATNLFNQPSAGRATFNVTPELAGCVFQQGGMLLLHRHDAEGAARRSICRSSSTLTRPLTTCRS